MAIKILILTPEIHFHSPVVMRELFSHFRGADRKFAVVLTPKISSNSRSPSSIGGIISGTGPLYLACMALMKLKFDLLGFREILSFRRPEERKFMSPSGACSAFGVECRKFKSVNSPECVAFAGDFAPDVIVSIFFNQILGKEMLACARKACLNFHPSCLPEYRGMSPVLWMLADGASEGGVTVHHMTGNVDAGNIVAQKRIAIEKDDTFFSLYRKFAVEGAALLTDVLSKDEIPEGAPQPETDEKPRRALTREAFRRAAKKFF